MQGGLLLKDFDLAGSGYSGIQIGGCGDDTVAKVPGSHPALVIHSRYGGVRAAPGDGSVGGVPGPDGGHQRIGGTLHDPGIRQIQLHLIYLLGGVEATLVLGGTGEKSCQQRRMGAHLGDRTGFGVDLQQGVGVCPVKLVFVVIPGHGAEVFGRVLPHRAHISHIADAARGGIHGVGIQSVALIAGGIEVALSVDGHGI